MDWYWWSLPVEEVDTNSTVFLCGSTFDFSTVSVISGVLAIPDHVCFSPYSDQKSGHSFAVPGPHLYAIEGVGTDVTKFPGCPNPHRHACGLHRLAAA
jgi:hypothetical protein